MRYIVSFSDKAERIFLSLPKEEAIRIKEKILRLELIDNPRKYLRRVVEKYSGTVYRYWVGDYRVLMTFKDDEMVIIVIGIGNRKNVYS